MIKTVFKNTVIYGIKERNDGEYEQKRTASETGIHSHG